MIRLTAELTPAGTSYLATGQGQPVVLIHGVGLNKEMWGGQVVGLASKYRVIAYDMLGHGASPRPASGTPLLGYAEQLLELLDHLQLPAATVIGFSMGGLVARAFALHYPERLQGLVAKLNSPTVTKVRVIGHTDGVGSDSYNQALSERRASSVAEYLIGQGLEMGKVTSQGRGESEPVTDNETEEGRARNRRVELHLN